MASVIKANPALDIYRTDPNYPGYPYANDSRYESAEFRQKQAERLFNNNENDRPISFEAFWINTYCLKEIEELKKKEKATLDNQPDLGKHLFKLSTIIYQSAQVINQKLPTNPTLRYIVETGTVTVACMLIINIANQNGILGIAFRKTTI